MNYGPFMGMPYFSMMPTAARGGLFSRLLGGINFSSILNNTQRTLGIVNQAIPVIKQVQPVIKNAKTMFKVMNEFKRTDTPATNNTVSNEVNTSPTTTNQVKTETTEPAIIENNGPTFFM